MPNYSNRYRVNTDESFSNDYANNSSENYKINQSISVPAFMPFKPDLNRNISTKSQNNNNKPSIQRKLSNKALLKIVKKNKT